MTDRSGGDPGPKGTLPHARRMSGRERFNRLLAPGVNGMPNQHDIQITEMSMDMNPHGGKIPVSMTVASLAAVLTDRWLQKMVITGLQQTGDKLPVEIEYEGAQWVATGAEVTVKAGAGRFLKASATVVIGISGEGPDLICVEVKEIQALGMLPVDSMAAPAIEKGMQKAAQQPGVSIHPTRQRALLIDPNVLLRARDIPLVFQPGGRWAALGANGVMNLRFTSGG